MLEKFLLDKHGVVEEEAIKEKAGISYIVNLIEQAPEKFKDLFGEEGIYEEKLPKHIYTSVEKLINKLDCETTRLFGVSLSYFVQGEEPKSPEVNLGWASYVCSASKDYAEKHEGGNFPHLLLPTEKGLEILNGYRNSLGYISIEDHKKKNKEHIDELTSSQV